MDSATALNWCFKARALTQQEDFHQDRRIESELMHPANVAARVFKVKPRTDATDMIMPFSKLRSRLKNWCPYYPHCQSAHVDRAQRAH